MPEPITEENVSIAPYDPKWPDLFRIEKEHLLSCLPTGLVGRIEHFGSTAVPGMSAKPIIDLLVEVTSLEETKVRIVPILEAQGYEYFWSPNWGGDVTPRRYVWFIKRDARGKRTHHIHMIEPCFTRCWDRLLFRDYLICHPEVAAEYEALKLWLAAAHPHNRPAYTRGKMEYIARVTDQAKQWRART